MYAPPTFWEGRGSRKSLKGPPAKQKNQQKERLFIKNIQPFYNIFSQFFEKCAERQTNRHPEGQTGKHTQSYTHTDRKAYKFTCTHIHTHTLLHTTLLHTTSLTNRQIHRRTNRHNDRQKNCGTGGRKDIQTYTQVCLGFCLSVGVSDCLCNCLFSLLLFSSSNFSFFPLV